VEYFLRRIHRSPNRFSVTAEVLSEGSGRLQWETPTSLRMANPWQTPRNRHHAIRTSRTHMMFHGTGLIDIHLLLLFLNDHMCRAAPRRP
jgi:hypothetical protein